MGVVQRAGGGEKIKIPAIDGGEKRGRSETFAQSDLWTSDNRTSTPASSLAAAGRPSALAVLTGRAALRADRWRCRVRGIY